MLLNRGCPGNRGFCFCSVPPVSEMRGERASACRDGGVFIPNATKFRSFLSEYFQMRLIFD
ncbi:hypothetical protein GGE56_007475 [Rhizobium leguminosarum]|nr:hypothetical protein [Rhizobium leguminosarum]MBB4343615.1 hypothetical protein [Rhizobium leguminosarum]MBB4358577.1 hypothetical protein [Rhizobium leguminosarum]MBB4553050.1 hypothetical protein [Rhizobium leguminosarum]MBB4565596.1 hypothetical protein [Rhizobium leguminosarum]